MLAAFVNCGLQRVVDSNQPVHTGSVGLESCDLVATAGFDAREISCASFDVNGVCDGQGMIAVIEANYTVSDQDI